MKKFFALFLCILYLTFSNAGIVFADNLYFVKNSNPDYMKNRIVNILEDKNYTVKKQNPYYAIYNKNSNDYILIILQKSSENYFYYFDATNNTSVNKAILKELRNIGVVYEESFNTQYLSMFQNQASKVLNNTVGQYNFSQPTVTNKYTTVQKIETPFDDSLRGSVIQVAKGSTFKTYLETAIDTSSTTVGDEVRAVLTENWMYNGALVAPQGSLLTGKLKTARHATYGSRNGRVVFTFDTLTTPEGQTYSISTEDIDFTVTNDGKLKEAVANVAVGIAVGALTGLIYGACSKDTSTWASTAISAGAGAAAAGIKVAAEKGVDAEIPVYTELEVKLLKPFSVVSSY
ncbi:MAG: hypothetical protein MJ180_02655 [Candidatus Gastranaerophilales bacterium]|nr:hypothetical protein [Candidatus Gastranaerophilales bacterium]